MSGEASIGILLLATLVIGLGLVSGTAVAERTATVGGAPMYASKNIIENIANSKDHTIFLAAMQSGGLVERLSSSGPFTVFAPTNAAFERLPTGAVDGLLKPENKNQLVQVLLYHIVPGKLSTSDIRRQLKVSNDKLLLKTVEGDAIRISEAGRSLLVEDSYVNRSKILVGDANQSNGVIHVIDAVLLPSGRAPILDQNLDVSTHPKDTHTGQPR